ncbi:hypothetical protein LTR84_007233 [Exophiala bonariae]|uniref:Transcription factor domain-containing protein n=1 Tax=Exophiala bonariae TaxID=1690606 RepID=A0AAV9N1X4_9EURO|nr:hypothetical protein LTR84_007233 [Exophiala bonariae]
MAPGILAGSVVNDTTTPSVIPERQQAATDKATDRLFSLKNTTTIVTGAGRGLGIILARAIAEAGGHVACLDILPQPAEAEWRHLESMAKASQLSVSYHCCDITNDEELQEVFSSISEEAQARNAPLQGTVACAGIQQKLPALEYPARDFEKILGVNVTGAFLTAKNAAKIMVATGTPGSIVLIASMSGNIANRGLTCTAYNASKAAVRQMCRSLSQEWGQYGIRVNTLSPGYIRTAMTDALLQAEPDVESTWMAGALLGRLGTPEDFKAPIVFLLAQGSSFMTGADLRVDGGHCATAVQGTETDVNDTPEGIPTSEVLDNADFSRHIGKYKRRRTIAEVAPDDKYQEQLHELQQGTLVAPQSPTDAHPNFQTSPFSNSIMQLPQHSSWIPLPHNQTYEDVENTAFASEALFGLKEADFQFSPGTTTDDGVFLPGSRYQALHNTLRSQVFLTAQSVEPSREASPSRNVSFNDTTNPTVASQPNAAAFTLGVSAGSEEISDTNIVLTAQQEYILWKNWIDEISAWLDKFDIHKHFRHTIPTIAKKSSHLRYAMLALSSRQLERKNGSFPAATSLMLYQQAIHKLLPEMHTKDVSVVASCVILCVLEMLSCSPKAWRRHLDGCACLLRAMNIRGDSGGVEQALFWCFARMDVCGGLISTERTLIPIDEWMTTSSFEMDCAHFCTPKPFEDHANYACYLLGRVLHFLFGASRQEEKNSLTTYNKGQVETLETWVSLFTRIEDWYTHRPPEMQELLYQSASSKKEDPQSPFPTILYGSGAAISGNQLHHTAALLMLQRIPRKVAKKPRSMLWHARQICAISMSNTHHGCWTNSVQPLWLAGQLMSHHAEHRAIIEIYERIERDTGWGAMWRADDLKQHWGDLGD